MVAVDEQPTVRIGRTGRRPVVGVAEAARLPSISLSAEGGLASSALSSILSGGFASFLPKISFKEQTARSLNLFSYATKAFKIIFFLF